MPVINKKNKPKKLHTFHRVDVKGEPKTFPVVSGSGKDIKPGRLKWLKKKQQQARQIKNVKTLPIFKPYKSKTCQ